MNELPLLAADDLRWLAENDPDKLTELEELYQAELDDTRRHYRPPVPGTPGAFADAITSGREEQAAHLDLIDEAFLNIAAGDVDRVLFEMPPQHGKSRRAARWGPAWYLARFPTRHVLVGSHGAELAADHGRFVRDMFENNQDLGLRVDPSSRAAHRWQFLEHGGGMRTAGVGGPLTGRPGHLIVIDDPVKNRAEADSTTFRNTLREWYTSVVLTRLQPVSAIVLIMTRWHEDDLAGWLLAQQPARWKVVRLPALAEDDADPLGRAPGDPLWPEHGYTRQWLDDKRLEVGPQDWSALYQQRPTAPEGAVWRWTWITTYRVRTGEIPMFERVVVSVDPPASHTETSAEAGIIVAARGVDGEGYVLDDQSRRASPAEWGVAAWTSWIDHDADTVVIEDNQGGDMAEHTLRVAWGELAARGRVPRGAVAPIQRVHASRGKRVRAEPIAAMYEAGRWHHVGQFDVLESQLTGWTGDGASPDRLDALVWAGHALFLDDSLRRPAVVSRGARLAGRR